MTNEMMAKENWVYIPSPKETFKNKKKGTYHRKNEELLTIEMYLGKTTTYPDKAQFDLVWKTMTDGPEDEQDRA
jgi:hypothetical protein